MKKTFLISIFFSSFAHGAPAMKSTIDTNSTFVMRTSFPKPLRLHHLGDWQRFEATIVHACSVRLVRNRAEQVLPDFAQSWTVSPSGTEITFRLRENAVFADSTPITGKNVELAIVRHIALNGQYATSIRETLAGEESISDIHSKISSISSTDKTLTLKLKRPTPDIFSDLGMLSFSVFKESDLSSTEDKISTNFVSSGPYKIKSFSENLVLLEHNKKYWDKNLLNKTPKHIQLTPETKTKEIDALLAGEIDVAHSASSAIDKTMIAKNNIQIVPAGNIQYYITPDFKGPTLSRFPQLVKIINTLLDRDELIRRMKAHSLNGMTPITGITANIDLIEEQEKAAFATEQKTRESKQEELKKVTLAMTATGVRLKFARRAQGKFGAALSDSVVAMLKGMGIPLEVEDSTSAFTFRNKRNGEFDIYWGGEMFDTVQPLRALKFVLNTDPQHTNLPATHPVFEITSRKPSKYEDHIKALQEFNNLNRKDGFVIPLVSDQMLILFSKKVDTSRVPNDFVWHPQDVSLKALTNENR